MRRCKPRAFSGCRSILELIDRRRRHRGDVGVQDRPDDRKHLPRRLKPRLAQLGVPVRLGRPAGQAADRRRDEYCRCRFRECSRAHGPLQLTALDADVTNPAPACVSWLARRRRRERKHDEGDPHSRRRIHRHGRDDGPGRPVEGSRRRPHHPGQPADPVHRTPAAAPDRVRPGTGRSADSGPARRYRRASSSRAG